MKKKAMGLWVRVSDPKQLVTESDVHHQVRGEEFIKNRGWEVKKIYRLGALSGESVMKYSEAKIMMRDIRIGLIDGLVFSEISRLARNTRELIEIAEYFDKYGAVLIAMNMSIDMSTPMGRHFYRTMGSNAQLEREMIVERINGSIITRAQLGKRIGGHAPLGYQYVDKKLEINPDEVAVCTAVFETFLECKRKRTTARLLNEKGYRTRKGNLFSDSTVKRILTDSVYKGLYRMNHSTVSKEGKRIEKPKEEWFFHEVASIIPKELWENVNTILRNQYSPRKKPMNTKIHLFTQYVYCHCGARMFTHNKTKNYICKDHCGNLINKEDLEEIFKTELHSYLDSQSNIEQYFKQLQTNL
ncbi:recombinase family protein, partial [Pontimicrobium sp. MEBiC01747]